MIIDTIENAGSYSGLYPGVDHALNEMKKITSDAYPQGKRELNGSNIFLLFKEYETHSVENALCEAHRDYLDVMYMVEGEETIYVKPTSQLRTITKPYDASVEALLGKVDDDCTPVLLKSGMFIVLFPQDAHAPACHVRAMSKVKKIIAKVRIER